MNIGFFSCMILCIPFALIGTLFALYKERAAIFVSGFNSLPKREQALYDRSRLSRDIRNQCFTWSALMLLGALLSYILSPYTAIPAFAVWLYLLFRDVHLDAHKAFEKYRIE